MATDPDKLDRYIRDLGLSFRTTQQSYVFTCPLCQSKARLYIRKSDGKFKCFKCATYNRFSGQAEYALQALTKIPLREIREHLYGHADIKGSSKALFNFIDIYGAKEEFEVIDNSQFLENQLNLKPIDWPFYALPIDDPRSIKGAEYLAGRGIPLDIAKEYLIRYSVGDRAIMFPVIMDSVLYGWQYRTIDPTEYLIDGRVKTTRKAWSSPNLPTDHTLMFADRLKGAEQAVILEGPIDAIKCHKFGLGNVCTMGKQVSQDHVQIILKHGVKRAFIGIDLDAFSELDPIIDKFKGEIELLRVPIPEAKTKVDLGSLSFDKAFECLESSYPLRKNQWNVWFKPF